MSKKIKRIIFYSVVTIIAIALLVFVIKVIIPWLANIAIGIIAFLIVVFIFAMALNH